MAVLAVLSVLFLRTLRESTSAPYLMRAEHLTGWQLTLNPAAGVGGPVLALTPPRELTLELFQQVFQRTMESMNPPAVYAVTLIQRGEFSSSLEGLVDPTNCWPSPGKSASTVRPSNRAAWRCGPAARPTSLAGRSSRYSTCRSFTRSGRESAGLLTERGGDAVAFDPSAAAPVLYLAATDGGFRGWPAADAAAEQYCVAPLELAPDP